MDTQPENPQKKEAEAKFALAIKQQLSLTSNWNGESTAGVIRSLLVDSSGKAIPLDPKHILLLKLATNPTVDIQLEAVRVTFEEAGIPLNEYELAGVRRVLNPQMFRQELIEAKKIKPAKRLKLGKLADMLS